MGTTDEPEYRFAIHDLRTRAQISEHLPFEIHEYGRALTEPGTTSAALNVADERVQELDPWSLAVPRRTTLVVVRDEVVMAEYVIWQRPPYKPTERKLNVNADEIRSYFARRRLRPTTGIGSAKTLSFTQVDQLEVFRQLVADCQAVTYNGIPVGDIGVELGTETSGVLVDRRDTASDQGAYHGYEFRTYGELFDELANADNGFEWRIDSYFDTDRALRRVLRLGYPQLGRPPGDDSVTLEFPGSVVDYEWPDDGSNSANYVAAIGAGEETAMRWDEAFADAELTGGFPLLETTTSYKSVSDQGTLNAHASADVAALAGDASVPSFTVHGRPDISPGDHVKIRISDPARFPGSDRVPFETFLRAVQITTEPGPPEKTTITAETPRTPGEGS